MRRGKPLKRTGFQRKPINVRKVVRNNPPRRNGKIGSHNPMSRGWTQRVFALYGRHCLACPKGTLTRAVQAHHVVPRQRIQADARKTKEERDALEYDARNGFPICLRCHELHEYPGVSGRRIRLSRIPELAREWAREHGYDYIFDSDIYL